MDVMSSLTQDIAVIPNSQASSRTSG
jgi:hypothetical protein